MKYLTFPQKIIYVIIVSSVIAVATPIVFLRVLIPYIYQESYWATLGFMSALLVYIAAQKPDFDED